MIKTGEVVPMQSVCPAKAMPHCQSPLLTTAKGSARCCRPATRCGLAPRNVISSERSFKSALISAPGSVMLATKPSLPAPEAMEHLAGSY